MWMMDRERVYGATIVAAILMLVDGALMIVAFASDMAYAVLDYALWSFFPLFVPAAVLALVCAGLIVYGHYRRGWRIRTAEWASLGVVLIALTVKIAISVRPPGT